MFYRSSFPDNRSTERQGLSVAIRRTVNSQIPLKPNFTILSCCRTAAFLLLSGLAASAQADEYNYSLFNKFQTSNFDFHAYTSIDTRGFAKDNPMGYTSGTRATYDVGHFAGISEFEYYNGFTSDLSDAMGSLRMNQLLGVNAFNSDFFRLKFLAGGSLVFNLNPWAGSVVTGGFRFGMAARLQGEIVGFDFFLGGIAWPATEFNTRIAFTVGTGTVQFHVGWQVQIVDMTDSRKTSMVMGPYFAFDLGTASTMVPTIVGAAESKNAYIAEQRREAERQRIAVQQAQLEERQQQQRAKEREGRRIQEQNERNRQLANAAAEKNYKDQMRATEERNKYTQPLQGCISVVRNGVGMAGTGTLRNNCNVTINFKSCIKNSKDFIKKGDAAFLCGKQYNGRDVSWGLETVGPNRNFTSFLSEAQNPEVLGIVCPDPYFPHNVVYRNGQVSGTCKK